LREALDGGDLVALMHDGEAEAGIDATAVDVDSARAALAVVATLLGAEELEVISQGVEQSHARLEADVVVLAIDVERDRDCAWNYGGGFFFGGFGCRSVGQWRGRRCDSGCAELGQEGAPRKSAEGRLAFLLCCWIVVGVRYLGV
jgi:hypothetical protein